ncbi:MAG: hypothetical protein NQU42_01665 [Methanothrix sp.]|uniref:GltB/FmdC/FwdC-like GXGXG domain-containing protein n=1 Tax=Methanothrix sp. TaxID=90426 RepID=UPI0025E7377D|nr:hypothetical protein [Methanothrix sp.]MCQ8902794.1 hypothetical protein [Methanothrix sp.]
MGLKNLMESAYGGKTRHRRLDSEKGERVISLEDLADRVGDHPKKEEVAELLNDEIIPRMISSIPQGKKESLIWGYITSIAAERSASYVVVRPMDFAGLELSGGMLILMGDEKKRPSHVGERMRSGMIRLGEAGDYLGQGMSGGGIVASSCGTYAFRDMRGGWGVILGDAGSFIGVNNSGGRILVKGNAGERAGWLMRSGRLTVLGDAGDYLGILAKGGVIKIRGDAGRNVGWRAGGVRIEIIRG